VKLHLSWYLNNLDLSIINYLMHCSALVDSYKLLLVSRCNTQTPTHSLPPSLFLCSVFLDPGLRTLGKCGLLTELFLSLLCFSVSVNGDCTNSWLFCTFSLINVFGFCIHFPLNHFLHFFLKNHFHQSINSLEKAFIYSIKSIFSLSLFKLTQF